MSILYRIIVIIILLSLFIFSFFCANTSYNKLNFEGFTLGEKVSFPNSNIISCYFLLLGEKDIWESYKEKSQNEFPIIKTSNNEELYWQDSDDGVAFISIPNCHKDTFDVVFEKTGNFEIDNTFKILDDRDSVASLRLGDYLKIEIGMILSLFSLIYCFILIFIWVKYPKIINMKDMIFYFWIFLSLSFVLISLSLSKFSFFSGYIEMFFESINKFL